MCPGNNKRHKKTDREREREREAKATGHTGPLGVKRRHPHLKAHRRGHVGVREPEEARDVVDGVGDPPRVEALEEDHLELPRGEMCEPRAEAVGVPFAEAEENKKRARGEGQNHAGEHSRDHV